VKDLSQDELFLQQEGDRLMAQYGDPQVFVDKQFTQSKALKGVNDPPPKWVRVKD